MTGILLVYKPKDKTSRNISSYIKKLSHGEKTGHLGTLDPMATGVLVVLLGRATRLADLLMGDKVYRAKFVLGAEYDTGDITGNVIKSCEVNAKKQDIEKAIESFKGNITQLPPMHSAVKKDGQPLYKLARQGIVIERQERSVVINDLQLIGADEGKNEYEILVDCSKGTYIRTLCEDIAKKAFCLGAMSELERVCTCGVDISQCATLEQIEQNGIEKYLIGVEQMFSKLESVTVNENAVKYLYNGGAIEKSRISKLPKNNYARAYDENSEFLGIIEKQGSNVKMYWRQEHDSNTRQSANI